MNNFIIKKFVKNYEDVKNAEVRERYGSVAGIVGIVSNVILCAIKILIGLIFNSIAILSDGINNLADASGSLITLIGFKLASKKPDKDHPYGYGRIEYITGLIVSVMVLIIGVELFKTSLDKTFHPEELEFSIVTILALVVAIAIKLWQSSFNVFVGKKIASDALIATAADSRNDVISTSAVLLAVIFGKITNINIDGPAGILVACFIIWAGLGLIKETLDPILGQTPDPELCRELEEEVMSYEGVLGTHDMIIHDYGPGRIFATIHVEVDGKVNVFESHDLMDTIEFNTIKKMGIMLTCHMDPLDKDSPQIKEAQKIIDNILPKYEYIKSYHDLRLVTGPSHTNVIFDIVVDMECKETDSEITKKLGKDIHDANMHFLTVINVDRSFTNHK